ncbi:MAG: hypothetical protein ACLVJ6_03830 [Merdibacter sp.]
MNPCAGVWEGKVKRCRICLCELSAHQSIGQWLWMTDVLCRDCRARFVRVKEPLQIQDLCVHALYRYDDFLEGLLFQFRKAGTSPWLLSSLRPGCNGWSGIVIITGCSCRAVMKNVRNAGFSHCGRC